MVESTPAPDVFLIGGMSAECGSFKEVYGYWALSDSWQELAPLERSVDSAVALRVDRARVWIVGGRTTSRLSDCGKGV